MQLVRRYRVRLTLLALVVVLGLLVLYRIKDQQARAVTRSRPDVVVGTVLPARRDMEIKLAFTADVLPTQQAGIFSKVSGYIRRIHAERGDFVKAGQALAEIDDLELRAAVDQAHAALQTGEAGFEVAGSTLEGNRANLENQQANLTKARAVADNDARQADRMKRLYEGGLVAATEFENARTIAESSRAGVQAAEAQLRVADVQIATAQSQVRLAAAQVQSYRAALQLAETNLANTRLVAPFSGFVSQRNLDPGAAVSAQSAGTNTASVGILTLQDIETVKVQIEVPERNIARVIVGSPVRLTVDPYKGETFAGSVARVVHNLDPRTRTMGIEVEIPNPGGRLKPGMFARVEVLVEVLRDALTIPSEAIRVGEAEPTVMVVREGVVEAVPVGLGAADALGVQVLKGLSPQDQVILQGKDLVKPKQRVRAVPATGQ
jgi:RND family efflux transporter MFP subunit